VTPEKEMDSIRQISPYLEPGRMEELLKGRESEDRKQLDEFIPPSPYLGAGREQFNRANVKEMSPCGSRRRDG
jgi:hypothetical protein